MRLAALLLLSTMSATAADPVRIIFDTDMGNDIDDALALAMLHALESRGECRLLGVTLTKDHPKAAQFVDAINTFYGRPEIPVGVVRDGATPEEGSYLGALADHPDLYSRNIENPPEAVELLRRLLGEQPNGSVILVQVGFSTNLARLVETDRDLVARKVRLLSLMGGAFPALLAEYNIKTDLAAAQKLFAQWPTEIVVSGFEIGLSILYPAASIEQDFNYVEHHPIPPAYRAYKEMPYDRPTWDLTSVLYAVRPERGYFNLSPPGEIHVNREGYTRFRPAATGKHRFLTATDEQRARAREAMTLLASQPPDRRRPAARQ